MPDIGSVEESLRIDRDLQIVFRRFAATASRKAKAVAECRIGVGLKRSYGSTMKLNIIPLS
jgi:hypothetical protein